MTKLEELMNEWAKDSQIDRTEPGKALIDIPQLHSKYLNILSRHKLLCKEADFKYSRMKKIKWEYYTGKMSQEDLDKYGWEPFRFTLKSDITTYLESDGHLIKLLQDKMMHDEVCEACVAILKELNNRTWQLREHMTHERFIQGAR